MEFLNLSLLERWRRHSLPVIHLIWLSRIIQIRFRFRLFFLRCLSYFDLLSTLGDILWSLLACVDRLWQLFGRLASNADQLRLRRPCVTTLRHDAVLRHSHLLLFFHLSNFLEHVKSFRQHSVLLIFYFFVFEVLALRSCDTVTIVKTVEVIRLFSQLESMSRLDADEIKSEVLTLTPLQIRLLRNYEGTVFHYMSSLLVFTGIIIMLWFKACIHALHLEISQRSPILDRTASTCIRIFCLLCYLDPFQLPPRNDGPESIEHVFVNAIFVVLIIIQITFVNFFRNHLVQFGQLDLTHESFWDIACHLFVKWLLSWPLCWRLAAIMFG